jgi:hypothetical protein
MSLKSVRSILGALAGVAILAMASAVPAQFRIHSWESFENGLPPTLRLGHLSNDKTVMPIRFDPERTPPEIRTAVAQLECGMGGVLFRPVKIHAPHLSLYSPISLDRALLGTEGRALYQVDVYLPPPEVPIPNISVLAQVLAEDGSTPYTFYRFGLLEDGARVYFSFTNNKAQPDIFESQSLKNLPVKRPGWNRLQIIFHGQQSITCALNAVPTSFSPIIEGTHRRLNAGIMVTDNSGEGRVAILDNLSIQWTNEEAPIPESPWTKNFDAPGTLPLDRGLFWQQNPSLAWQAARTQKRPMLVLFEVPGIAPTQYLHSIYPGDETARALLGKYVLAKIDVNQLSGGSLAQRFEVVRVPTLIVMSPEGKVIRRIEVARGRTTWQEIANQL